MHDTPRPLSHRLVLAAALAAIALITMGSAPAADEKLYDMSFTVQRDGSQVMFDVTVTDHKSGKEVAHPHVNTPVDSPAEITTKYDWGEIHVAMLAHLGGQAEATLRVLRDGKVVETVEQRASSSDNSSHISLTLKDADVRDVVNTFGKLANLHVIIDEGVSGTVTVDLHDVPWTQALDQVIHDAGLHYALHGSYLHVTR